MLLGQLALLRRDEHDAVAPDLWRERNSLLLCQAGSENSSIGFQRTPFNLLSLSLGSKTLLLKSIHTTLVLAEDITRRSPEMTKIYSA